MDELPHPLRPQRTDPPAGQRRFQAMWQAYHRHAWAPGWWVIPLALIGLACWGAIAAVAVGRFLQ